MTRKTLDPARSGRLLEVGRSLVSELDLEVVLGRVLEAARDLTGARYAALGILDESREQLERFLTLGVDAETRAVIGDLPRGRGVLGELIRHPQPLRLARVSDHPRSYGFPHGHPPMTTFLGVPILIRGEAYGNLYLTDRHQGEFDEHDEEATVVLAEWAAIAIENARLYERTESRREELQHAVQRLQAASEIAEAVGGELELDRVLELIAKRGRSLVEARSLVITLREGDLLVVAASAGDVPPGIRGARVPIEGSLAGHVLSTGTAERFPNLTDAEGFSLAELGIAASAALDVPLIFRGQSLGVLAAFDRMRGRPEFGPEDEVLLRGFAASAATAVHTAKSATEARLRQSLEAAEQERRRWARELHDETLQGLGALRVMLASGLKQESAAAREAVMREAIAQIGHEVESLRALITELRPAALDELGLLPAIESLLERTAKVQGVDVDARLDLDSGGERLSGELESTIYRLVQEALTNIAKHARADHVWLSLSRSADSVRILIRDDGRGFDPADPSSGFGLAGMRERVELAGGTLKLSSTPGEGTEILAMIPVA